MLRTLTMTALCACLFAAPAARAAEPKPEKRLMVADLKAVGIEQQLAQAVTDALLDGLKSRPGYRTIGRSEITLILEHENERRLLGCTDESCLADLGTLMKADVLCGGSVGQVGKSFLLNVYLTEVRSARVLARASETAASAEDLLAAARRAADALFAPGDRKKDTPRFAFGKGRVSMAVLDLTATGVEPQVVQNLTQVVVNEVKNVPGSAVISRDEVRALIQQDKDRNLLSCDDSSCLTELGGALGVGYLVSGTVGRVGGTYLLHLKLMSVREARIANRVAESFSGDEAQLIAAARFAAKSLVGLGGEGDGKLEVRASVPDPKLLLDGQAVDRPGVQALRAGRYNLRLEADGFQPWFGDVYVDAGQLTRVDVSLVALPQPWYRKWWVWTAVGAAAAGATTAAILVKGSQKAEQTYTFGVQVQFPK